MSALMAQPQQQRSQQLAGHAEEEDERADADEDEEGDQSTEDEDGEGMQGEYVVALHDFASTNATCLSFQAGQVIRVFNRDTSGWWDGELNGERGWFPSNYVDADVAVQGDHGSEGGQTGWSHGYDNRSFQQSVSSGSVYSGVLNNGAGPSTARTTPAGKSSTNVLEPIQHSIALLSNAVKANRWPHFQPATACVISSVRSVLSATDCLTRESQTLRAHPILAKERKLVLSELSRLVTQSRRASAVAADQQPIPQEMEEMLRYAGNVLANTRRFLAVAVECGASVTEKSPVMRVRDDLPDRSELDKTPTPGSSKTSYLTAQSIEEDQRGPQPTTRLLHPNAGQKLQPLDHRPRTNSDASYASSSGDSSPAPNRSRNGSLAPEDSSTELVPSLQSRDQVLDRLRRSHEYLLSIIASFVGHVHVHTRESHASSYAYLIDVTREAVDGVRNLLVLVEGVHDSSVLNQRFVNEMAILWETRGSLYEATTSLVTAARVVTSKTTDSEIGQASSVASSNGEDEKARLLSSATALLRTAQESVGAARMVLSRVEPAFTLSLAMPTRSEMARDVKVEERKAQAEAEEVQDRFQSQQLEDTSNKATLTRGHKHTISSLGRKASSLTCLKQQYEMGESGLPPPSFPGISEEDLASSLGYGNVKSNTGGRSPNALALLRENLGTLNNAHSDSTSADLTGDSSDVSEAMSRHLGRTSGSTMGSLHSSMTADTSARPSLDRRESGASLTYEASGGLKHHAAQMSGDDEDHPLPALPPPTPTTRASRSNSAAEAYVILEAKLASPSYDPTDVCYNSEGQVTGATLAALIERMTPHDTLIDATFSETFFLCFRLFTSPMELLEGLMARYNLETPEEIIESPEAMHRWINSKVLPIRLRVLNVFKTWLETYWQPLTDRIILDSLLDFIHVSTTHQLNRSGQRLAELAQRRLNANGSARTVMQAGGPRGPGSLKRVSSDELLNGGLIPVDQIYHPHAFTKGVTPMPPSPLVSKSLLSALRNAANHPEQPCSVGMLDFDPLELARQLTLLESTMYCSILPEELLGQEFSKKPGQSSSINVKKMSSFTTHLTGWITECILGEVDLKKRIGVLRYVLKLGDRCLLLNNFNALFAIQAALNTSTISRLKKTWDGLSTKYVNMMETQRSIIEHTRNFAVYRNRLRSAPTPALPFVGLWLTDLTFCSEGNAALRSSPLDAEKKLINFDRYVRMTKILQGVARFQVPFGFVEVPEIQTYFQDRILAKVGGSSMIGLSHTNSLPSPSGASFAAATAGDTNGTALDGTEGSESTRSNALHSTLSGAEELYQRSLMLEPRGSVGGSSSGIGGLSSLSSSEKGSVFPTGRGGANGGGSGFNWKL